jgi:serine protease Do
VSKNRLIAILAGMNLMMVIALGLAIWRQDAPSLVAQNAQAAAVPATSASARRTELVNAAESFSASVVSVGASQSGYALHPYSGFFDSFMAFPYEKKIPYLGSGVIIDPDGLVVTNSHVVEDAKKVFVTLIDGREIEGEVVDADMALDVALIRVKAKNLPAAKLGDSSSLKVGEWVLAMGNPFGNVIGDPTPTVTAGVVSALKRSFKPSEQMHRVYLDMIQTDAAINPGNSGGALINAAGELVGINTFIVSRSGGAEGIGFAIPIDRVKTVVQEIVDHGKVRPRLMDFQMQNLTGRIAKMVGVDENQKGAVVSEIVTRGPAQRAGLQVGDVITKVGTRSVTNASDATAYLFSQQVGARSELTVDRAGKEVKVIYEITEPKE